MADQEPDLADKLNWAGSGALRIALLFGSAAMALALILTPLAERGARSSIIAMNGKAIDPITTTSISTRTDFTIRRSVLQPRPSDLCIIHSDGRRSGSC